MGTHVRGFKDVAGLLKWAAARLLARAWKEKAGLSIHSHSSGIAGASVFAAMVSGADMTDNAIGAYSVGTSQPWLSIGPLTQAERDAALDAAAKGAIYSNWEAVCHQNAAFQSRLEAHASENYVRPGDQFTNLKAQARSMGLKPIWHEVAKGYAGADLSIGDITKVTPTPAAVGDMALMMVNRGLSRDEVDDTKIVVAFLVSVIDMSWAIRPSRRGGWPAANQKNALKSEQPVTIGPRALVPPAGHSETRVRLSRSLNGCRVQHRDLNSYLIYPQVIFGCMGRDRIWGPARTLITSVFFYGMQPAKEISVEIDLGRTLEIRLNPFGKTHEDGDAPVLSQLNGQPRVIPVMVARCRPSSSSAPRRKTAMFSISVRQWRARSQASVSAHRKRWRRGTCSSPSRR